MIYNGYNFEEYLEEQFIERLEYNGIPIIKDNCEDLFSQWLEDCDKDELIELADKWGRRLAEKFAFKI